jgi:hypothetical protein
MYFIMIYILFFIILVLTFIFYLKKKNEGFDIDINMFTREGQYTSDMFSSRDIPVNICSKII